MKTRLPSPSLTPAPRRHLPVIALFSTFLLLSSPLLAQSTPATKKPDASTLEILPGRGSRQVVKLSDPTKAALVRLLVGSGDLVIRAEPDVREVIVESSGRLRPNEAPRSDGLRVLGRSSYFTITEEENVVEILQDAASGARGSLTITVPSDASIEIENSLGGRIRAGGIGGDLEIRSTNSEILLEDLRGGALVETMNGSIQASFVALNTERPLSFTSMNGKVNLLIPADARADLQLRTHNGTILTDFDEGSLDVTTEEGDEVDVDVDIDRDGPDRDKTKGNRAERSDSWIEHEKGTSASSSSDRTPRPPRPLRAPRPPSIPAVAGGSVISGALNGGGTTLQAVTMNGDIVVRKRSTTATPTPGK